MVLQDTLKTITFNTNLMVPIILPNLPAEEKKQLRYLKNFYDGLMNYFYDHEADLHDAEGHYRAIPSQSHNIDLLHGVRKIYKSVKILDVGCGYGNIMRAAGALEYPIVHGIEIRKKYKSHHEGLEVFYKDALKFKEYQHYDVIYAYCPMHNSTKMKALTKVIIDKMASGAILIANGFGGIVTEIANIKPSNNPLTGIFQKTLKP